MKTVKQIFRKNPENMTFEERSQIIEAFRVERTKYLKERKTAKLLLVPNHPEPPVIVSNIPIPVEARGGTRKFDHFYPFELMKPGDSFWVQSGTQCTAGAVTKFAKRTGWRFVSRGQTEDGVPNIKATNNRKRGTRIWRIS